MAVDTSSQARGDTEFGPGRRLAYHPSRRSNGGLVVAGWNYCWAAELDLERNSCTAPADASRIWRSEDAAAETAAHVKALVGCLAATDAVPTLVSDPGYDPIELTADPAGIRAQMLLRIRSDRVFDADPPARAGGESRDHGVTGAASVSLN